jgi:hypothetical protein
MLGRDPKNALRRWALADCLYNLSYVKLKQGDVAAARGVAHEGIDVLQAADLGNTATDLSQLFAQLRKNFDEFLAMPEVKQP